MQQFTVPQFIDVESKIIGPITTRQFLIFLGAAVLIGVFYKTFDFSLFVFASVIAFLLAIIFAFVKVNGRPFHFFVLNLVQTLRKPGLRVWNNRSVPLKKQEIVEIKKEEKIPVKEYYKKSRLAELALIADTKGRYKGE